MRGVRRQRITVAAGAATALREDHARGTVTRTLVDSIA